MTILLLKDNKQHLPAMAAILDSATGITAYNLQRDGDIYHVRDMYNGGFEHDDLTRIMAVLWKLPNATISVPLGGKYYAEIVTAIDGKYASFSLIFSSRDARCNTCVPTQHYNVIGGYWYTSEHEMNKTARAALQSTRMTSITALVRAFNRAAYLR